MKKMRTEDVTGAALNWLVAKCEGVPYRYIASSGGDYNGNWWHETRNYCNDWSQASVIIEREFICIKQGKHIDTWAYIYQYDGYSAYVSGPTVLVAAMRAYVVSKLGPLVEVPEELL